MEIIKYKVDPVELTYEIKLSQGKGFLTKRAEFLIIQMTKNLMTMKHNQFKNKEDAEDCEMTALWSGLRSYSTADLSFGRGAFSYISENIKRGIYYYFSVETKSKYYNKNISLSNLNFG